MGFFINGDLMSRVDRNLPSMPVPEFAFPDRHDGRVFVRHRGPNGKVSKRTIGYMTDSTRGQEKMVPNRYFRDFYPELYLKESQVAVLFLTDLGFLCSPVVI